MIGHVLAFLWYVLFPIVSLIIKYLSGAPTNDQAKFYYDALLAFSVVVAIIMVAFKLSKVKFNRLLIWLGGWWIVVVLGRIPFANLETNDFSPYAFIIEMKLPVYLFSCLIIYAAFDLPNKTTQLNYTIFFSCLVLLDFLIGNVQGYAGYRPFVVAEANYDNLIVLLGLVILLFGQARGLDFFIKYFLFASATLVSQSRTGLIAFFLISLYAFANKKRLPLVLCLLFLACFVPSIFSHRMGDIDYSNIDRFVMWRRFFLHLEDSSWNNIIFGHLPGIPIVNNDDELSFFVDVKNAERGIFGFHAFNYHSLYLRYFATFGVLGLMSALGVLCKLWPKGRMGYALALLVIIEGFSMGVFYLSVTVVPLLYVFASPTQSPKCVTHVG